MTLRTRIHAVMSEWADAGDDVSEELKLIRELVELNHALAEAVTRLLPHAEDDAFQYGADPDDDEDIVFARATLANHKAEVGT